jgi:hypothetical protein
MKRLLILPALLLAGTAIADSEPEVRVNSIDMAAAAPEETVEADGTTKERQDPSNLNSSRSNTSSRAQDYNSSRSNTTALREQDEKFERADNAGTRARDYNSSRSNISTLREQDEAFDRPAKPGTRAQDYNSSRSNTTALREDVSGRKDKLDRRLDPDDDGDRVDDTVCRNGVDDDCDSAIDAAPANHNTTRSNRTSP